MENKKLLIIALVLDVVMLVIVAFFYVDRSDLITANESMTKELSEAKSKLAAAETENASLTNKLAMMSQGTAVVVDGESERLKKAVDEKDAEISRLKASLESAERNSGARSQQRGQRNAFGMRARMQEHMERLKSEDPEQYEQMQVEREKRRKELQDRLAKRDQLVNAIDTSKLNADQKQLVSDYQALIKASQDARAAMESGEGEVDMRELMYTQRKINAMSSDIRDILIEQYASSLGASGRDVAAKIKSIIEATTIIRGRPGGHHGGPPGN